jgi:WD40 repeat protein
LSADAEQEGQSAQVPSDEGTGYQVDARGAEGVLVGDQGTQINYFYHGTWTDGVAPTPLVSVAGTITSPYRGLTPFGERDAGLFFGRESVATEVLELMSRRLDGPGLLVVSGESGAGKSSLLRAGVLPLLRGAGLRSAPEAASWPCLVFTPERAPLQELAARVAPLVGVDAGAVWQQLAMAPTGFALTARAVALAYPGGPASHDRAHDEAGQRRLLIAVDQCEQLFTRCQTEQERQAFITALHAAATTGYGERQFPPALVVMVIRADFEARLANYPLLTDAVKDRYLLTAMTERQLRMAITRPALTANSSVDDDLVQVLLEEVRTRAGASAAGPGGAMAAGAGVLPLLSHALDQAWRGRTGQTLTLADYERSGGIEGAVRRSAERAYGLLTPAQQGAARQVFTRLTATSSDNTDTAARASRSDLIAGKDDARARDVETVLETFATERLLTLAAGTVEISHEALLTAWPLLRDTWLAETHADRVIRTRLHATAEEWASSSRDPAFLYAGSRLEIATDAASRIDADPRHVPLSQTENDFLNASRHASRRRARRRRGFVAALMALVVCLAVVSAVAFQAEQGSSRANQTATSERDAALAELLAARSEAASGTNATVSQQESIAALSLDPDSPQARFAVLAAAASSQFATFATDNGPVDSVAFSLDGKTLGVVGADTAEAWDVATGRQIGSSFADHATEPNSEVFSPDGKTLAVISQDGSVRLWDVATGHPVPLSGAFAGADGGTASVAFSLDGKMLATVSASGPATPIVNVGGGSGGDSLGPSPVQLWDVATGHPVPVGAPFSGADSGTASVAFSPDGKMLATTSIVTDSTGLVIDGPVRLWNVSTGRAVPVGGAFAGGDGGTASVAFSPDGKMLATVSAGAGPGGGYEGLGGPVQLWNVTTGHPVPVGAPFAGANGGTNSVAFSPNGEMLATGSDAGDGNGTAQLWNVMTRQKMGSAISSGTGGFDSVAFSPDGGTVATGDGDGTVQLWNVARAAGLLPAGSVFTDDSGGGLVAFSPGGTRLAAVSDDGSDSTGAIQLWNVTTGHPETIGGPFANGTQGDDSVSFSQNGKVLAAVIDAGTGTGPVQLWDVTTSHPKPIGGPFGGADGGTLWVALSPDGKTLATINNVVTSNGNDDTVQLWDVTTSHPKPIGGPFGGAQGGTLWVAFSPDGKTLVTIGDTDINGVNDLEGSSSNSINGTAPAGALVQLWDVATGRPTAIGSPFAGANGGAESVAFSPDGTMLATVSARTVQRWDVARRTRLGDPLASGTGQVDSAVFSPDGTILATGGLDGTVRLWDVATGQQIGSPLTDGTRNPVESMAFTQGGTTLAVATSNGTAELWSVGYLVDPLARVCSEMGGSLTGTEWADYAGPGPAYRNICPGTRTTTPG